MCKLIMRYVRQSLRFFMKLTHRQRRVVYKTSEAMKGDGVYDQILKSAPFCQITLASGAKWACDREGNFQLLDANGIEMTSAVLELFDYYGINLVFVHDSEEKRRCGRRFAAAHQFGLLLPMKYLQKRYQTEDAQCDIKSVTGCGKQDNAVYKESAQCCHHPGCIDCPLEFLSKRVNDAGHNYPRK